jgi:hypothetical protein
MRTTASAAAVALAAALCLPAAAGVASPLAPEDRAQITRERGPANGPERNRVAAGVGAPVERTRVRVIGENSPRGDQAGYPRQTRLRVYPVNGSDAAIKPGLVPYHSIAPRLNALQQRSRRVSVEVIGQSGLGRDLYFVTLTRPESPRQAARQEAMRRLIEEEPEQAARSRRIRRDYKVPVLVNGNIHGNEWEGTDGILTVVERLATSRDQRVRRLLATHRLYFNVTLNPDGRVAGTRNNTNGINLNRDWATASQPEIQALRPALIDAQPVMLLDEHGYTGDTLIEPTTPPHGANYEYDLFIRPALDNGLGMEQAVQDLGYPETQSVIIPFRDLTDGWDDWPPIFTPQYGLYHGAIGYTIEWPLPINNEDYQLPAAELRRRSAINTEVAVATIETTFEFVTDHRRLLIDTQIEQFRRGQAGEPLRFIPDGFVPGWGPEDRYTTTFPRGYVIPAGADQRSAVAAARLVDHLVANDVEVLRARRSFRAGGQTYPAGSYAVDMHQSKRGLANVMLEAGQDISDRVPAMYDISGWSHGLLWGASVDVVENGRFQVPGRPVVAADPRGGVFAPPGRALLLRLLDGKDVAAANELLGLGVTLRLLATGNVVIPATARPLAEEVADRFGVRIVAAPRAPGGSDLDRLRVAAAVAPDELVVLRQLGFDAVPISTAVLNAGFDWSEVDVAFVASGLSYPDLTAQARAAFAAFAARGGVVTRGATGASFNADAGLLEVATEPGRDDANGVVRVTGSAGPVTGGAPRHSFVYSPLWFTDLGPGVTAAQRYAGGDPLVAGHWLPNADGSGSQGAAAGQAAVVSGSGSAGGRVVMFGTEPLFRDHTKGLYAQVGRALYWASPN